MSPLWHHPFSSPQTVPCPPPVSYLLPLLSTPPSSLPSLHIPVSCLLSLSQYPPLSDTGLLPAPPQTPSPLHFPVPALSDSRHPSPSLGTIRQIGPKGLPFGLVWPNGGPPFGLAYQTEQNSFCSAKRGADAGEGGAGPMPRSEEEMGAERGRLERADAGEEGVLGKGKETEVAPKMGGAGEGKGNGKERKGDGGGAREGGCWGRGGDGTAGVERKEKGSLKIKKK